MVRGAPGLPSAAVVVSLVLSMLSVPGAPRKPEVVPCSTNLDETGGQGCPGSSGRVSGYCRL